MRTVRTVSLSSRDRRALCRDLYKQDSNDSAMATFNQRLGSTSGSGATGDDSGREHASVDVTGAVEHKDDGQYITKQDLQDDATFTKKPTAPSGLLYPETHWDERGARSRQYDQDNDRPLSRHKQRDAVDMADHGLNPGHFSGGTREDGRTWLLAVKTWLQYRNLLDRPNAVPAVGLLTRGAALQWFQSLSDDEVADFEALSKAFTERYIVSEAAMWRDKGAMFDLRQRPGQKVLDFITEVEGKGRRVAATEDAIIAAVLNGLP